MINRFLMERRCCDRLEKYVSDRVWSEPYAEYRTNTRPRILNTRSVVEIDGVPSYTYALAAGVLGGPREQLALPSSDGYYVYSIELNQFRSIKLSATSWIRLDTYCNGSKKDVKVYTDDGVTLWRGGIYIKQSPLADEIYIAVNAQMLHKFCDKFSVNPKTGIKTVVTRADPTKVFFTKYVESDYIADDTVKCIMFDGVNIINHRAGRSPVPNNVTTIWINGRLASGNWRNDVSAGDYAEYMVDEDVVSDVLIDRNDPSFIYKHYAKTTDTSPVSGKTYYIRDEQTNKVRRMLTPEWYVETSDTSPISNKTYYTKEGSAYTAVSGYSIAEFDSALTYYEISSSDKLVPVCDREIIHIAKSDNPDNKLITYVTCDIYLIPGNITTAKKNEGYTSYVNGVYFHQCDRADVIHQLTHNDFSIDVDALDAVAAANGFDYKRNDAGDTITDNLDYTIRVVCRSYTKKSDEDIKLYEDYISKNALVNFSFGAVRDSNYCDLLYSYNHSDATILKFLREDSEVSNYNMYFWGASWLEENSSYAVAMMNRVGPTTKNASKTGYYRAPIEKNYIAGKTYYRKVPYQFPTDTAAPSPDLGEGIRSLDTDVDYERADVIAGDTVKDGILEFKEYPGIQVSKTTQCANCGLFDACQYGGRRVFGDTVLQRFTEEICPEFSVRSLTDYIRIFGYYHTLSLVCKRVTTYYVKKLAANYPFNYEIKGTVHFSGLKDELPVIAITNEIVLLSDKVYQYTPTTDSTPISGKRYYVESGDWFADAGDITEFASGATYYTRASSGLDGDGRALVGNHYYQYYKDSGDTTEAWHDITGSVGEINHSLIENIDQEYDVTIAEPVYVSKANHATVRPPLALYDLGYDEFYPMVYVNGVKLDDSLVQIVGDVQYDIDGMLEQHWTYSPMFGDTNLWDTDQRRLLIKLGVELKAEQIDPETGKVISSGDYVTIEILPRPKADIVYKYTQVNSDTPEEGVEYFIGNATDGYESVGELTEFDPNTNYFTREIDEDETEQVISSASTVFDLDETEDGVVDGVMQRAFEPLGSGDKLRENIRLLGSELVYLNGKQLVPGIDYVAFSDYNRGVSISTDTEPDPSKNYYVMKNGEYIPFTGSAFETGVTYYEGDTSKDELDTILQNVQYLENYTANDDGHHHINYTCTTDVTIGSAKGFVVGNWIAWDGISPIWFDNLSLLIVGGRVCSNFAFKYSGLDIRGTAHENGEPYQVRTLIPKMVLEMMTTSENARLRDEDDQKYRALRNYFSNMATNRGYRALIPYSHKIYSTYMLAIIKDFLNGDLDFEMYVDRDLFLSQFRDYEGLKKYDVVFNNSIVAEDLRFVDIYPVYHRHDIASPYYKRKIAYLVEMLTPSDAMRHREHINGK